MKNYKCSIKELNNIYDIFLGISDNIVSSPNIAVGSIGVYSLFNESILASLNRIQSINLCCDNGCFVDAFTLVRKYRDDLLQYIFISRIMDDMMKFDDEKYHISSIKNLTSIDFINIIEKKLNDSLDISNKTANEIAVEQWRKGKLDGKEKYGDLKKVFSTTKYIKKLIEDPTIDELFNKYLRDTWFKINDTLNDYVHGNGYDYIVDNYSSNNMKEKKELLIWTIIDITSIILSFIILEKPNLIQSTDYVDYLDAGLTPPDGCQYFIMSTVLEYINEFFPKINENLLFFLEKNNKYGMKLLRSDY